MQTTINPNATPDAARLALKLVEWNYGTLCKVTAAAISLFEALVWT